MTPLEQLAKRYADALGSYLRGAGEQALQDAYQIGRWAVGEGLGLMDVVASHRAAVLARIERRVADEDPRGIVANATEFLEDCLGPFEMIYRGFDEANTLLDQANRELEKRNHELELARKQRERLTALVVHDLKSPLSGIVLNARVISRNPAADDSTRSAANNIASASQGMQRMVMDILDISRSEEAELVPKPVPVSVANMLERVAADLSTRAQASQQTVRIVCEPATATIVADEDMIRRVLANLLDNALRYSPREATVDVFAIERAGEIEFSVADRGPGIPAELRDRVFDPYVQLEAGQRTRGGHGLGLAFCRLAVAAHGGSIHNEDREGGGTVFVVRVPKTPGANPAEPQR